MHPKSKLPDCFAVKKGTCWGGTGRDGMERYRIERVSFWGGSVFSPYPLDAFLNRCGVSQSYEIIRLH